MRGLGAMDGGGHGCKGGAKSCFGWCVDGERGDNGVVPVQGGRVDQER